MREREREIEEQGMRTGKRLKLKRFNFFERLKIHQVATEKRNGDVTRIDDVT